MRYLKAPNANVPPGLRYEPGLSAVVFEGLLFGYTSRHADTYFAFSDRGECLGTYFNNRAEAARAVLGV